MADDSLTEEQKAQHAAVLTAADINLQTVIDQIKSMNAPTLYGDLLDRLSDVDEEMKRLRG